MFYCTMRKKDTYKELLAPTVELMEDGRARIIFSVDEFEMACLYYEAAKKGWTNKPISTNQWRCVDAKITDTMVFIDGMVEPKELVGWGNELIKTITSPQR